MSKGAAYPPKELHLDSNWAWLERALGLRIPTWLAIQFPHIEWVLLLVDYGDWGNKELAKTTRLRWITTSDSFKRLNAAEQDDYLKKPQNMLRDFTEQLRDAQVLVYNLLVLILGQANAHLVTIKRTEEDCGTKLWQVILSRFEQHNAGTQAMALVQAIRQVLDNASTPERLLNAMPAIMTSCGRAGSLTITPERLLAILVSVALLRAGKDGSFAATVAEETIKDDDIVLAEVYQRLINRSALLMPADPSSGPRHQQKKGPSQTHQLIEGTVWNADSTGLECANCRKPTRGPRHTALNCRSAPAQGQARRVLQFGGNTSQPAAGPPVPRQPPSARQIVPAKSATIGDHQALLQAADDHAARGETAMIFGGRAYVIKDNMVCESSVNIDDL